MIKDGHRNSECFFSLKSTQTMETNIQFFSHEVFGEIRTMTNEKGETFFVGKDVARALGYNQADKAILRHVDDDDRTKHTVVDSRGRVQLTYIINESGLNSLILSSKLEQARAFKALGDIGGAAADTSHGGYIPTKDTVTGRVLTYE